VHGDSTGQGEGTNVEAYNTSRGGGGEASPSLNSIFFNISSYYYYPSHSIALV